MPFKGLTYHIKTKWKQHCFGLWNIFTDMHSNSYTILHTHWAGRAHVPSSTWWRQRNGRITTELFDHFLHYLAKVGMNNKLQVKRHRDMIIMATWHADTNHNCIFPVSIQCSSETATALTPSTPSVPNCCCSEDQAPYWSNPPFLICDIRVLWRSFMSTKAPECQKLKKVG